MKELTFAEKVLGAQAGSIVFRKPDIVLSHDNTASIEGTFRNMGGSKVVDPHQLMVVLDHNAPPTNSKLANDYLQIKNFVKAQGVEKFHDVGDGICHQLMSQYARPGMLIVGSDSHTCTAGAFNAFATGIDRTEAAGLWKQGETWFRVPESMKISLHGRMPEGSYAKDLALHIIGMIGSSGADYLSVEFHGDGLASLSVADRMTVANLASEMGAKNAVFPADEVLQKFIHSDLQGVWADSHARYLKEITIDLADVRPLVACPHHVDHVKTVDEMTGTPIQQALIGTCTNGRIEDLRIAGALLKGRKVADEVHLLVTPASRAIYLQAVREGLAEIFLSAGANILTPSCGPCLGTGQGIPADGLHVISTANRNFLGRMGNPKAFIYLASPATVALSAINGFISSPSALGGSKFPYKITQSTHVIINDHRYLNGVWAYHDVDNFNTDQMFAGNLTYEINSTQAEKIVPYMLRDFDPGFSAGARKGDIIVCGENFGCGSSREHPAVGFVKIGIKAILVKSVSRIFYRSAINQGLPIFVVPEAVNAYHAGDKVEIAMQQGTVSVAGKQYSLPVLPAKLLDILERGGLVKALAKG